MKTTIATLLACMTAFILPISYPVVAQDVCPKGQAIRNLEDEYRRSKQMAEIYQRSGMGLESMRETQKSQAIANRFPNLYLDQEIRSFPLTGDVRCLSAAYSQVTGREVRFELQSGGKWDVYVSGVRTQKGLSDSELVELINRTR